MQESYSCDKPPLDRHLTIRVPSALMTDLVAEKDALDFPYVSSLVRYLLSNRARTSGMYSKKERMQIALPKSAKTSHGKEAILSIKVTQKIFNELEAESKAYGFKRLSPYIVFILGRRFLKTGALRQSRIKSQESRIKILDS